jgi:hypothetical protein
MDKNILSNTKTDLILILVKQYKQISIKDYYNELEYYKKKIQKKNILSNFDYKCNYCNKIFTRNNNYQRHIKKNICSNPNINVLNKRNKHILDALKKKPLQKLTRSTRSTQSTQLTKLTQATQLVQHTVTPIQQITNNTTNNTDNSITNNTTINTANTTINTANTTNIQTQNNNNQQNIIIAVSGKKNIEEVCKLIPFRYTKYKPSVQDLISYFNNPNKAIQHIIINEHFNSDKPEQMNIHNTNCRSNRMQVFDEDENGSERWITRDKTDVCDDLYEKSVNEMFFAKHNLKLKGYRTSSEKEKNMNDKIHQLETNKKIRKEYMNKISDITWDYKDVVHANKRNLIR